MVATVADPPGLSTVVYVPLAPLSRSKAWFAAVSCPLWKFSVTLFDCVVSRFTSVILVFQDPSAGPPSAMCAIACSVPPA